MPAPPTRLTQVVDNKQVAAEKESAKIGGWAGWPTPFWAELGGVAVLYHGHVVDVLKTLPARSVHCCVTSPPYWGLRDYGTGTWINGSKDCDHSNGFTRSVVASEPVGNCSAGSPAVSYYKDVCGKCGAKRIDQQLGGEDVHDCFGWATGAPCGECFTCHMVEVFTEVRRVLRDDGTLWLNLGDTFDNGQMLVPTSVAMALRVNGWKLVQDIIWYAPNKMPESVTNRCSKSHEHIFLLSKGGDYYFDHLTIQDEGKSKPSARLIANGQSIDTFHDGSKGGRSAGSSGTVNKRDVWVVPTQGYPGAHFACFSPRLIEPCILAGTSEYGCCATCGKPYERVIAKSGAIRAPEEKHSVRDRSLPSNHNGSGGSLDGVPPTTTTIGWEKKCGCKTDEVVPCTVLDPFTGSGTTPATSMTLGRRGVGIDLSEVYLRENAIPRIEAAAKDEKVVKKAAPVIKALPPLVRILLGKG